VSAPPLPHRPTGQHLLADLHGVDAALLTCTASIEALLRDAALAAGATIVHGHFHSFGPQQGVTGVLLLAESHISIHTWPEWRFAALDVFMCGAAAPQLALEAIARALQPERIDINNIARGSSAPAIDKVQP
jgi:S-adenosylmethionine decarboxylase